MNLSREYDEDIDVELLVVSSGMPVVAHVRVSVVALMTGDEEGFDGPELQSHRVLSFRLDPPASPHSEPVLLPDADLRQAVMRRLRRIGASQWETWLD